jgi:hypothetical protein
MAEPLLPTSPEVELQPYLDVVSAYLDDEVVHCNLPPHLLGRSDDHVEFDRIITGLN